MRPKDGWKIKRDSYSKLIVYFKDGNVRTFWSLDWRHKNSRYADPEIGLKRLRKMMHAFAPHARMAMIYDKETDSLVTNPH